MGRPFSPRFYLFALLYLAFIGCFQNAATGGGKIGATQPSVPCGRYGGQCVDYSQCHGHWHMLDYSSRLNGLCPNETRAVICCVPNRDVTQYRYHPAYYPYYHQYQHYNYYNQHYPYYYGHYQHGYARPNNCGCGYDYAESDKGTASAGAHRLLNYVIRRFGGTNLGIYNNRPIPGVSKLSLHSEGRAVDIKLTGPRGREAFDHVVAIACQVGIQEVIHNGRIWTQANGEYVYRGVNPHTDYVHIGLNRCGAEHFNY